jgi:hypothetical protein
MIRIFIAARLAAATGINNFYFGSNFPGPGFGGPGNRGRGGPRRGFGGPGFADSFNGPDERPGGFGPPPGGGPGGFGPPGPGGPGGPGFGREAGDSGNTAPTADRRPTRANASPNGHPADAPAGGPPGGPPGFGGPPPFAGGFPGFGGAQDSVTSQAMSDLQKTLNSAKSTPTQIKAKIAALRAARAKAKEKMDAARAELLELISPEQEMVLISLGYLE